MLDMEPALSTQAEDHSPVLLLVEDDPIHVSLVAEYFSRANFEVEATELGQLAPQLVKKLNPDVVLLDVSLPDVDGFEVARQIRRFSKVPIIFLTGRDTELDKLEGFEAGADDYITKPFSLRELLARIKAVARRASKTEPTPSIIEIGPYIVDWGRREVRVSSGYILQLTNKELELLWYFLNHPDQALERRRLFEDVWGSPDIETSRTLDVHVSNLRQKLPELVITTIRGVGYRLDTAATEAAAQESAAGSDAVEVSTD